MMTKIRFAAYLCMLRCMSTILSGDESGDRVDDGGESI